MYRSRTLLDVSNWEAGSIRTQLSGSDVTMPTTFEALKASHVISDYVTPGWYKLIQAGIILNNPLSDSLVQKTMTGADMREQSIADPSYIITRQNWDMMNRIRTVPGWNLVSGSNPSPIVLDKVYAAAKLEAISKIEKTPFDFSEDVLELRKTLRTLINPLSLARDLSNDFTDRYKFYSSARFRSRSQSVAKAWLEVRFAYRPIMISLENILAENQLARAKRPVTERHLVRASVPYGDVSHMSTNVYQFSNGWSLTTTRSREGDVKVSAGIIYDVHEPLRNWRWRYGVRPRDLVRAVYNVIPYSWVVDRFLHIDQSIKGLTSLADSSVRIQAGWTKELYDVTDTEIIVSGSRTNYTTTAPVGSSIVDRQKRKTRQPWNPSVTDAFPVFHPTKLDTFPQVADLVSLILVRLRPQYKGGNYLI